MKITEFITEAANPAQQAAIAIAKKEEQGVAEAAGSREKFTDLKSWAAAAKQQGLRVGPANGDIDYDYSYWAVGKGGEVFGKFATTRVPQNNHGYIKKQDVAEGEVKQFPKKHTGDLDDVHDCVKCGGDLQGATYQGHRVKVCVPCKQVYLPPNSGIDQKGNKISEQDIEEQETTQKILKAHNPETIKKWVSDAESEGWVVKSSRTFPSGQIKVIMVKKQGVAEDDTHQIKGNELIEYLMKRFEMTREQAIELLKKKGLAEDWQKVNKRKNESI